MSTPVVVARRTTFSNHPIFACFDMVNLFWVKVLDLVEKINQGDNAIRACEVMAPSTTAFPKGHPPLRV